MDTPEHVSSEHEHYDILSPLAEGGMGKTFLVVRRSDQAKLVLKLLHVDRLEDWKSLEMFKREMGALSALEHEGIPKYVDTIVDESQSQLGLIQSHVDGQTLQQIIDAGQSLSVERLEQSLRQCLDVLVYLHQRVPPVIHRDITPRNIMVDEQRAYLIDFGSVKVALRDSTMMTSVGTFGFMAPEQVLGRAIPASDVYALGMSFVVLATGCEPAKLPADPKTGHIDAASVLHLPEHLKRVLIKMIHPSLDRRYDSAQAVIEALDAPKRALMHAPQTAVVRHRPPRHRAYDMPEALRPKRGFKWMLKRIPLVMMLMVLGLFMTSWTVNSVPLDDVDQRMGGLFGGHSGLMDPLVASLTGDSWTSGAYSSKLAVTRDGRVLSLVNQELVIWDAQTGVVKNKFTLARRRYEYPNFFKLSKDEQYLAVGFGYRTRVIQLYDLKTGKEVNRFSVEQGLLVDQKMSLDGVQLYNGRIYDIVVYGPKRVDVMWAKHDYSYKKHGPPKMRWLSLGETPASALFHLPEGYISGVTFSPDGKRALVRQKGAISLIVAGEKDARVLSDPKTSRMAHNHNAAFSADGKRFVVATNSSLIIVDAQTFKPIRVHPNTFYSSSKMIVGEKHILLKGYRSAQLVSLETGQVVWKRRRMFLRALTYTLAPKTDQLYSLHNTLQVYRWKLFPSQL